MNSQLLTYTLAANIGFLLYLLLLGIQPRQLGKIFFFGLLYTVPVALLIIIALPWLLIAPGSSFAMMFAFFNPIVLAFVIVSKARDVITPRVTAIELACLNVAAPILASGSFVQYLLNPFIGFLPGPPPLRILLFWAIALTPTWLMIAMVRGGDSGSKRRRAFLVLWSQVIYILLLLGPAKAAFKDLVTAEASGFVLLSLNGFALMQVTLGVISLWSLWKNDSNFIAVPKSRMDFLADRFAIETASTRGILITLVVTYAASYVMGMSDALFGYRATLLLIAPMIVGMLYLRRAQPASAREDEFEETDSPDNTIKASGERSTWGSYWWLGAAAVCLALLVLWQRNPNSSSVPGDAATEIVTDEGRVFVGRVLDRKTNKVSRSLTFERFAKDGKPMLTGHCYDDEYGIWVDFKMVDKLIAECRWRSRSAASEATPDVFVLCDFRAIRCFPSVPFGEEPDRRPYVGHVQHKQTIFFEADLCSIETEPPVRLRCGDRYEFLPDTQAAELQPQRWLAKPEFVGKHALDDGRQLICLRARAEGERESGRLEELHALVVFALDKDMNRIAPIRLVFDEEASCERLVPLSHDAVAYVLRASTSKLLGKGFKLVYAEGELVVSKSKDG